MGNLTEIEQVRSAYCGSLALIFLAYLPRHFRFLALHGHQVGPKRVMGLWRLPRLPFAGLIAVGLVFAFSLLIVSANVWPRAALTVAFVSYFFYFGQSAALDEIKRKSNTIPILLAVFLMEPWLEEGVEFIFVKLVLVQIYLFSAIQKLRNSSSDWISGRALEVTMKWAWLQLDSRFARWIGQRGGLCRLLSVGVLIFELGFVIVLFTPPEIMILVACIGLLFHLANAIVLKINYLPFLGPAYFIFLPEILQLFHH